MGEELVPNFNGRMSQVRLSRLVHLLRVLGNYHLERSDDVGLVQLLFRLDLLNYVARGCVLQELVLVKSRLFVGRVLVVRRDSVMWGRLLRGGSVHLLLNLILLLRLAVIPFHVPRC